MRHPSQCVNIKKSWFYDLKLNYQSNQIKSSSNTKFLGLIIDDSLSWKAHIDKMMSKLNTACIVIRTIQAMSPETLRMVYFAYIHSIMSYGIIFWGNQPYSDKIFQIQKTDDQNHHKFKNERFMYGTAQKIRNATLIFSIYLLNINIFL